MRDIDLVDAMHERWLEPPEPRREYAYYTMQFTAEVTVRAYNKEDAYDKAYKEITFGTDVDFIEMISLDKEEE